jgi:hypothetical protein
LGRRYREEVIESRNTIFVHYLDRWCGVEKWKVRDRRRAASTFAGLLRAGIFEDALHGLHEFDEAEITVHARRAATEILVLLKSGTL